MSRIVLVEDHEDVRLAFSFILRSEGHEVHAFADADSALQHCSEFGADIAVLDVRLPGRSGDDLGAELHRCWPNIRVIFMTGEYSVDLVKASVPGALVLKKPVDVDVLLALVNQPAPAARPRDGSRSELSIHRAPEA